MTDTQLVATNFRHGVLNILGRLPISLDRKEVIREAMRRHSGLTIEEGRAREEAIADVMVAFRHLAAEPDADIDEFFVTILNDQD